MSDDTSAARAAFQQGQARFPDVTLSLESFIARVREAAVSASALQSHGSDLYLATACLAGDRSALQHFDREYLGKTGMFVARLGQFSDFHQEVAQRLREKLLFGTPPKLAGYVGAGPLFDWLRVAAVRTGINLARPERTQRSIVDEIAQVMAADTTPELQSLLAGHRRLLQEAIEGAFQRLDAGERTLLRLQYIDRLGIDQLGTIYKAHRTTVARWLIRLRDRMMDEVSADLGAQHGWSPATLRSVWRACHSGIEVSVARLLGSPGTSKVAPPGNFVPPGPKPGA